MNSPDIRNFNGYGTWFTLERNVSKAWNSNLKLSKIRLSSGYYTCCRLLESYFPWSVSWIWDRMSISDSHPSLGKTSKSPRLHNARPNHDHFMASTALHYNENLWMNSPSRFLSLSFISLTSGFHSRLFSFSSMHFSSFYYDEANVSPGGDEENTRGKRYKRGVKNTADSLIKLNRWKRRTREEIKIPKK